MVAQDLKPITDKDFPKPSVTVIVGHENSESMIEIIKQQYTGPIKWYLGDLCWKERIKYYNNAGIDVEKLEYESDSLKWSHTNGGTIVLDRCFWNDHFLKDNLEKFTSHVIVWYSQVRCFPATEAWLVEQAYLLPCLYEKHLMDFTSTYRTSSIRKSYPDSSKRYRILSVDVSHLNRPL